MVSRIQNRNTGYSENLFSHNSKRENSTINSINGATALKLDQKYEVNEDQKAEIAFENTLENPTLESSISNDEALNGITSGVSMESASYMENNIKEAEQNNNSLTTSNEIIEEYTPKLFSEEQSFQEDTHSETEVNNREENESEELFDQDLNEEEDFEIPAFLRKQKF